MRRELVKALAYACTVSLMILVAMLPTISQADYYSGAGASWVKAGPLEVGDFRLDLQHQWGVELIPIGHCWKSGRSVKCLEGFVDYQRNAISGDGAFPPFGEDRTLTVGVLRLGACGVYEYDWFLTVNPFLRGCFGAAYAGFDPNGNYDAIPSGGENWAFNAGDIGYGWKLGGGLAFDITDSGRVRARLAYSYNGADGVSWTGGREHVDSLRSHSAGLTILVGY